MAHNGGNGQGASQNRPSHAPDLSGYFHGELIEKRRALVYVLEAPSYAVKHAADEAEFAAEVEALRALDHRNVVKLITVYPVGHRIVLELTNTCLKNILVENKLTRRAGAFVAQSVLQGLEAIHGMDIVHSDLRAENILINRRNEIKIAHFGLARKVTFNAKVSAHGAAEILAPEQALSKLTSKANVPSLSTKSDVFSLGAICVDIILGGKLHEAVPTLGELALHAMKPGDLSLMDTMKRYPFFSALKKVSPIVLSFLERSMDVNPEARSTASMLLYHQFILTDAVPGRVEFETIASAFIVQRDKWKADGASLNAKERYESLVMSAKRDFGIDLKKKLPQAGKLLGGGETAKEEDGCTDSEKLREEIKKDSAPLHSLPKLDIPPLVISKRRSSIKQIKATPANGPSSETSKPPTVVVNLSVAQYINVPKQDTSADAGAHRDRSTSSSDRSSGASCEQSEDETDAKDPYEWLYDKKAREWYCSDPDCGYSSKKKDRVMEHVNAKNKVRSWECKLCSKAFVSKRKLQRHEDGKEHKKLARERQQSRGRDRRHRRN